MDKRIGLQSERRHFVKQNPIFYPDNNDMSSYISSVPCIEEKRLNSNNNHHNKIVHAWGVKSAGPDPWGEDTQLEVGDTNGAAGKIKNDDEDVQRGCCGKNFDVFSGETSFHGVKHITGENNWSRRVAWIIILSLALTGLVYQLNVSVSKYLDYPSNTNLKYVIKPEIMFPKVTICNINMFKFDEVTPLMGGYLLFYEYGLKYLRTIMPESGVTSDGSLALNLTGQTLYPGDENLQDFIRYNGHKMKDMLEMCIFNGMECGPENFTLTYTNYGACFIFTPNSQMSIKNAGQRYGLSIILNVEHMQYITAPRENAGFRIAIDCHHDSSNIEASGVDVGTGIRASIGLKKHSLITLPPPHGTCIAQGTKHLKYFPNAAYTQSRCYLECETDYFMEACGCRTFYTPGDVNDQPFCSPASLTECYIPTYEKFITKREEYCDCKESCFAESFMKTYSFSDFPSRGVPPTMLVTGQLEYFALALGFNVKQKVEHKKNEICEYVAGLIFEFTAATFDELQLPNYALNLSASDYGDILYHQFIILTYDLIYFTASEISDVVFYELDSSNNFTYVNSEFYHGILEEARKDLTSQMDSMSTTFAESVQDIFPSHNYTNEHANLFLDTLLEHIYVYVYPILREACSEAAHSVYETNDLSYLTREYMKDNLARVDIYFESLNVEEIVEQKAYEFYSIVCDLGGSLGLFFGASLVAFVEAIDFWIIRGCCGQKSK